MLIIFSGFNQRAVIAFLRELKKDNFEDYCIVACGQGDSILKTAYSEKVFCIRHHIELNKIEIFEILKQIVYESKESKNVIVPSTEALDRFILEYRKEIEDIGVEIPLVDKGLYEQISDKNTFWKLCKKEGLLVPNRIEISESFERRYVAKPTKYLSSKGIQIKPVIVDDEKKHRFFLSECFSGDYDIEEFVDGESIYLLYYLAKSGEAYSYSQRNYVQQPGGLSILIAESSDDYKNPISDEYIKLLRKNSFWGFIMIELRRKDTKYYMIEANPRLWGPSQLFVDAKVPFIEAFLKDCGLIDNVPESPIIKHSYYLWSGGFNGHISNDDHCVWLEGGKTFVENNLDLIEQSDLFGRSDTMRIYDDELPKGSLNTWIDQIP